MRDNFRLVGLHLLTAAAFLVPSISLADSGVALKSGPGTSFGSPSHFEEQGGEAIYRNVCASCHMPDGRGAAGAGAYPALAANTKLASPGYPVALVLHGQKAMPPLGEYLSDRQIAEVVNFVRTHFGNIYTDGVTANDVEAAR